MDDYLEGGGLVRRVAGTDKVVRITPTLDTDAYAQNDIFWATTELEDAMIAVYGGTALWGHMRLWDKSKSNRALRVMILRANTSVGVVNAAEAISDADGLDIIAEVDIASGDYVDYANFSVVTKDLGDLGSVTLKPKLPGTSLWCASEYTDATGDTFAANDIVVEFGFSPSVGQ